MKAVILNALGGPEQLRPGTLPDPQPGPGEAVVRLRAAALNHRDVWIRKGLYAGIKLPIVLGSDGAGVVEAVGSGVDASLVGREVVINPGLDWGDDERCQGPGFRILGLPDDGTYAEMVRVPASALHPRPAGWSWEECAALPLAGLTAYRAAVTRAQVTAQDTVLITGIGGGVAQMALLICHALGARVLVTSGSAEKLERAQALGAEGGANYQTADWVAEIQARTQGQGPSVVIDSTGGSTLGRAVEVVRSGGRIVTFGATTGPVPSLEVRRVFWKQISLLGSTMGTPAEFAAMLELLGRGKARPIVDRVFPLADAAAAHARMEAAEQFGKIVLSI